MFLFNSELLPAFREGHYVLQAAAHPGTSLAVSRQYGSAISRDLLEIPGVATVEQQIGRSEGGEDTWGTEKSEFHLELAPHLSAQRQDEIEAQIHGVLDSYPGLQTEVLTFLGDRIGESLTGETAALVINIYGGDSAALEKAASAIAARISAVPDATDVKIKTPPKTPSIQITVNPDAAAFYGLTPSDVLDAVQSVYAGSTAAQVFRGDRVIDIAVTVPTSIQKSPESVRGLLLRGASGTLARLEDVASVSLSESSTSVFHNGGRLVFTVTANPEPQNVAAVTAAVQGAVGELTLPPGIYVEYSSVADDAVRARNELLLHSLLAFVGIIALLSLAFNSSRAVLLVISTAPFALVGGVVAIALSGANLSLGALVGFVTLFGIAARNAILLVDHADQVATEKGEWSVAVILVAARERVTPILMTALVTGLGLLPLAIETGQAGREIQGPMAIVILAGLASSTVMSLLILPALIWRFQRANTSRSL